jgi:hypothetical protein
VAAGGSRRARDFRRMVSDVWQAFFAQPLFGDYSAPWPGLFAADAILALPKFRSCAAYQCSYNKSEP